MSPEVETTLGVVLRKRRAVVGASLQDVASAAGCSAAYVHKLEQDRVRSPSPRVLGGLARALGLEYGDLMRCAGYEPPPAAADDGGSPATVRFSNAHVVELLEELRRDVAELRRAVTGACGAAGG